MAEVSVPRLFSVKPRPLRRTSTWLNEERAFFLLSLIVYTGLGFTLVLHYDVLLYDALTRVANAYYVFYSRDPHLAAIGFNWTPLPSLAVMPLLPLKALWPVLADRGLAGNFVSALFMAGTVAQVHAILHEHGVERWLRFTLSVLFAVHPMILFYGSNGMSEAALLFFLMVSARGLVAWVRADDVPKMVGCALALALAYLARYEAFVSGVGALVVVVLVSWRRWRSQRGRLRAMVLGDLALVALPLCAALAAWALASWVIVGHPFPTLVSRSGNRYQVALNASSIAEVAGVGATSRASYVLRQLLLLEPFVPVLVAIALVVAVVVRDLRAIAVLALLGTISAFQFITFVSGDTYGWLRYQVPVIPLATLSGGLLVAATSRRVARAILGVLAITAAVLALPGSFAAMSDPHLGREETIAAVAVWRDVAAAINRGEADSPPVRGTPAYEGERRIARYLDSLRLPDSSVLLDNEPPGSPHLVMASHRPRQFVIPNDRDFSAALADPVGFGLRYMLARPNHTDAISLAYPDIFESGAGIARLVHDFPDQDQEWRLFEVVPSTE